jgi:hypothetical protein
VTSTKNLRSTRMPSRNPIHTKVVETSTDHNHQHTTASWHSLHRIPAPMPFTTAPSGLLRITSTQPWTRAARSARGPGDPTNTAASVRNTANTWRTFAVRKWRN